MATKPFDGFNDPFRVDIGPAEEHLRRLKQMRPRGERAIVSLARRVSETVSLYPAPNITILRSEFEGPFWIAYELSPVLMTVHAIEFDPDHRSPVEEAFLLYSDGQIHALRIPPPLDGPVAWLRAPALSEKSALALFGKHAARVEYDFRCDFVDLCSRLPAFPPGIIDVDPPLRDLDAATATGINRTGLQVYRLLAAVEAIEAVMLALEWSVATTGNIADDVCLHRLQYIGVGNRVAGVRANKGGVQGGTDEAPGTGSL